MVGWSESGLGSTRSARASAVRQGRQSGERAQRPKEFHDVVTGAHEAPLVAHLREAAEREAAEAAFVFDLSEDRFDDGFSPRVDAVSDRLEELCMHLLSRCVRLG